MSNFKVSNNTADDWLICWTGQDENGVHWNVTTNQVHASQLYEFSKGAKEDARLIAGLLDLHYSGELAALRARVEELEAVIAPIAKHRNWLDHEVMQIIDVYEKVAK